METAQASVHKDMQHVQIMKDRPGRYAEDKTLSFTVAIKLPHFGGGLNVFHGSQQKRIEYWEGGMVYHTGMETHQIANLKKFVKGDARVTLQGHALWDEAGRFWEVYR